MNGFAKCTGVSKLIFVQCNSKVNLVFQLCGGKELFCLEGLKTVVVKDLARMFNKILCLG